MTFLTGAGIIDDAMSIIRNNSTSVRLKMLRWTNIVAQKLAVVRPWTFLGNGTAIITPVSNVLSLPADYGEIVTLQASGVFTLDCRHRLTPGEAQRADNAATGLSRPYGFTESIVSATDGQGVITRTPKITLHGYGFTDPVTVNYTIEPGAIADSAILTCWPTKCRPIFQRALIDGFYEYDMDERAALSYQLNAAELSELKKWDNSQKPRTQNSRHGYRRTR
jgi:hypothetical protein